MIKYNTGTPTEAGVYACRVPFDDNLQLKLFEDRFFLWCDGVWCYLNSDQKYRGIIVGWVGPLQRGDPRVPPSPTLKNHHV